MSTLPGLAQASAYLRLLLEQARPYRLIWEREAKQLRDTGVNYDAVARVLARRKTEIDPAGIDHRSLTETVRNALNGRRLSPGTLNLFIEAFDMSEEHAERLWALARGSSHILVVKGTLDLSMKPYDPPQHQTIMLHEFHYVGPDGLPLKHRTVHNLRAVADGLSRYPYVFDTTAVTVEVSRGGKPSEQYDVEGRPGFYGVDILFDRPLRKRETASFEYLTTFHYDEPPATCFRRAVRRRAENVEIRVEFHRDKLPAAVWWAEWEHLESPVKLIEPVTLDSDHAVHRYLEAVERAVVGFYWEW